MFEGQQQRGVWNRGGVNGWKRASAGDDVDAVFYTEKEEALFVVVVFLVGERAAIGGCVGEGREWDRIVAQLALLSAEEK